MPYVRNKLTSRQVQTLPAGKYGDGGGLSLIKSSKHSGFWLYRFNLHKKPDNMSLGSMNGVSLDEARALRNKYRAFVVKGINPKTERDKINSKRAADLVTLNEVALEKFEATKKSLVDDGKAGRWFSPLKLHVLPALGKRPIIQIDQNDIRETLSPIWHEKPDTARKAMNRLNMALKHAAAMGLPVDMQVVEKAKALLGKQDSKRTHVPSMPWRDVPDFYASLTEHRPVQLALRLLILNPGPRSKPIRFLHEDELEDDIWTVPAIRMKGIKGKTSDFRVPLSPESLKVLDHAKPFSKNGHYFPNVTGKGVISDASMSSLMKRRGLEYRPHGFRASFRTWAAETNQRRDIAELCLAHKIYGGVEASYVRTDQIDERRILMNKWSEHVTSAHP